MMNDEYSEHKNDERGVMNDEQNTNSSSSLITHHSSLPTLPVFYDEQKLRWPWLKRMVVIGGLVGILAAVVLAVSVFAPALLPRNPLPRATTVREIGNQDPILSHFEQRPHLAQTNPPMTRLQRRQLGVKFTRDRQKLEAYTRREQSKAAENARRAQAFLQQWPNQMKGQGITAGGVMPFGYEEEENRREEKEKRRKGEEKALHPTPDTRHPVPVIAAFYVNWEETSWASAQHNMAHLTHFLPEWLHLKQKGADVDSSSPKNLPFLDARDDKDKTDVVNLAHSNSVPIVVLLNNYTRPKNEEEGEGKWDTDAVHALVSDPKARRNFARQMRDWLLTNKLQGVNIDFEEVAEQDKDSLTLFMRELYTALHPAKLLVTQDVQLENGAFDFPGLAKWNDWLVPMFYDEHESSSGPGAIAGIDWTHKHLDALLSQVDPSKVVMAVGQQGYDWTKGVAGTESLRYQTAVVTAKESYDGKGMDGVIRIDPASLNPMFTYSEDTLDKNNQVRQEEHTVWMQDAASVYNQLLLARPHGIRGAALWMLGAEDPTIWSYYDKNLWNGDWQKIVSGGALNTISYGGTGEIDFTAEGELLQPVAEPTSGQRTITQDPKTGMITAEAYKIDPATNRPLMPSSYIVRRYGGKTGNPAKQIVLTFDDGPDPTYTPQILDILKRYHVPAAFFVVGKMAEANPNIVRRMWDEGHEIGNHTWDHRDLAELTPAHQSYELTATERVIQALTGHSTTLFRPPYGNDVEPTTGAEVRPLDLAAQLNYLTVGQKIDPLDWALYKFKPGTEAFDYTQPKTAQDIVNGVWAEKDQGSIVLLHDAGGDRTHTVAALPQIIEKLRAGGYTFISVSQLSGIPREKLMPPITGKDIYLAGGDRVTFEAAYLFQITLTTLFMLSIVLGTSRVLLFVGLALIQRQREKKRVFPVGFTPSVSVIIAAYNEEKVIGRTIQALLDSGYPNLEIIVVDDGSKDNTSEVVQTLYGDNPLVKLIVKPNGGKASALNQGLTVATGDIMVSLDADTLFTSDTIGRLARHFINPQVGAVSGNVRVGNTNNIWTRWQAIEYTTSQNFDRRGYDLLNCITVVPGAVGAMRREAVLAVGGYTHDTLAEDTDLTWKLRRSGWRIVNDNTAMAYTEAPESLKNLAKQRFRWAFGTLQCLWKHRGALGQHGAFGWLALPSLWVYQILFPAISPFMDIAMVWSLCAGNGAKFAQFYVAMFALEFTAALIALRMDRGNLRLLPWLFFQRFLYRQLMYYVVLRALWSALRGSAVGWNKFERTGTARVETKTA